MSSFLEQYGVAIFVLVIIAILVFMASPVGKLIKGAVMDQINKVNGVGANKVDEAIAGTNVN